MQIVQLLLNMNNILNGNFNTNVRVGAKFTSGHLICNGKEESPNKIRNKLLNKEKKVRFADTPNGQRNRMIDHYECTQQAHINAKVMEELMKKGNIANNTQFDTRIIIDGKMTRRAENGLLNNEN